MYSSSIASLWEPRSSASPEIKAEGRIDLPFAVTLTPGTIIRVVSVPAEQRKRDTSPQFRLVVISERSA
jgi:hypothetical protein